MVEALCPELLLEVLRSQYLLYRNHTHSDTQTNKKRQSAYIKKTRVPKSGLHSLPWASPRGVEVPVPFTSQSYTLRHTQTNKKKTKCLHKKSQSTQGLLSLTQSITLSPFQILQPFWQFSAKAFHIVFSIDFPAHFLNASFELISGRFPRAGWGLVLHPLTNQITIIIAYIFSIS